MQFFFYGMGESKMGNGASSWILHMAFIILVSSAWGLFLKKWKGVSRRTFNDFDRGWGDIIVGLAGGLGEFDKIKIRVRVIRVLRREHG